MAIAVLDVGKTNVKLVLFEGEAVVWQKSARNPVLPGPPYPHADVEGIWRFLIDALREAAAVHAVDRLVVTAHGATVALVGEDDLALPVMDYEFSRVDDIEAEYAPVRPPFSETLSPPLTAGLNFGRQIFWQQRNMPEAFARVRHILMYPQYFGWRLTGVAANEVTSLGCHGDIWRPVEGVPSTLVQHCGWLSLLPSTLKAWEVLGTLRPEVAAATGLPPGTEVITGIHDSNASVLPHLLSTPAPFTVVSTGTWVVIMAVGGDTRRLDPARDMQAYVDATGRPLPAGKFMGGREFAILLDGASPEADPADLAAVLAAGAMALPAFVANGGPFPHLKGDIRGPLPARPGARAALASLYAALMTDLVLDDLGADTGPLIVENSFADNRLYCAILATLRPGQGVLPGLDGAGTAHGASLLATWPRPPAHTTRPAVGPLGDAGALLAHRAAWRAAIGQ